LTASTSKTSAAFDLTVWDGNTDYLDSDGPLGLHSAETTPLSDGDIQSDESTDGTFLSTMTGNGVTTVPWWLGSEYFAGFLGSGGAPQVIASSTAAGTVTVTYYYDPVNTEVPEASGLLAVIPLGGIAAFMFQRRRMVAVRA